MHRGDNKAAGFSLVELLTILVLLGIVSVFVVARLDIAPFRSATFEQELRTSIRFAQKFALVSGCDVQVVIDAAADRYDLYLRNNTGGAPASCLSNTGDLTFGTPLNNPTGGVFSGTAPANVDISAGLTFVYGPDGGPSTGGPVIVDGRAITVEPVTGYVH